MRRLLFLSISALVLGALLVPLISQSRSYLLIVVGNTSIEITLWFAMILLLALFLLIWLSWAVAKGSLLGTSRQMSRLVFGSRERAQRQTSQGLIAFMEGNWRTSLKLLRRSSKKSEVPLINYLAAARSAYELGEEKQVTDFLRQAEGATENAELAVALTQARMQLLGKKFEQCAATLQRARKLAPKHPVVLDLLQKVYFELQDWQELEAMLPNLRRYKILDADELIALQSTIYQQLMQNAAQSQIGSTHTPESRVKSVWQKIPKELQQHTGIILRYSDLLQQLDCGNDAEILLRKALKKNWDSVLVERYGLIVTDNPQLQLLQAEGWLKERPGNALLMLTLGRLSLRNGLWGKAKDYLNHSLALQGSPQVYAELARLMAHMGELDKSTEYYQQGLLLSTTPLPDLPMPSDNKQDLTANS